MAVPKRRSSHSRSRLRRAHQALDRVPVTYCPQCGQATLPHKVCPHCGYYKGREVVEPKET